MVEFVVLDVRRGDASAANVALLLKEGYELAAAPDGLLVWRKAQPRLSLRGDPPEQPAA